MGTLARGFVLALILPALVSCAPQRADYLKGAVNQATQDDVTKRLGPPQITRELTDGSAVWRYRGGLGLACLEYILIFDQGRILREWRKQDC